MDKYVCSILDLPDELYRVDYPGSRVVFSAREGFVASDTTKTFNTNELGDLKRAIEKQFTWSCRDPLPFISLFSNREHAENWGCKEPWRRNDSSEGSWALHVISTIELRNTHNFFRLRDLMEKLSLDIPERAEQHIQGAFICLHRIPVTAIVERRTPTEVEEGEYSHANIGIKARLTESRPRATMAR
jgi:hypothetical protein